MIPVPYKTKTPVDDIERCPVDNVHIRLPSGDEQSTSKQDISKSDGRTPI